MTNMESSQSSQQTCYKVMLILLVTMAALSSALRDLNQLQELTANIQGFASEWLGDGLVSVNANTLSLVNDSCNDSAIQTSPAAAEFRWSGRIAPGQVIEIKGLNGDISAEAGSGSEAELIANKKGRRSDANAVEIKVVEHAAGVTICALYPTDDPAERNICEPGSNENQRHSSATIGVRNNDVRVDFTVKVPSGVRFVGRTVNGEISATSLAGNVSSHTVNGSIKISTSGYAEAKTVNGEISARLGDPNWPGSLEFTTVNGSINLDLPSAISTEVKADTFNGEILSDFSFTAPGTFRRKHLSGTIGSGGRELILKTLNGSINLRRAG